MLITRQEARVTHDMASSMCDGDITANQSSSQTRARAVTLSCESVADQARTTRSVVLAPEQAHAAVSCAPAGTSSRNVTAGCIPTNATVVLQHGNRSQAIQ